MVEPKEKVEEAPYNLGKPLDHAAKIAEQQLVSNLREALLVEANKISEDDRITDDDLILAYRRLQYPNKEALRFADAQTVISQAFRENQLLEWISYGMAIVYFVVGLILLIYGITYGEGAARIGAFLGGSIVELLILIPFRMAINSRRHNIALRMLGLVLNRVDDPKKLAPLLKDTFLAVVLGKAHLK